MAKDNSEKAPRGLFGLGSRPAATAADLRAQPMQAFDGLDEIRNMNLRALAGAAVLGGSGSLAAPELGIVDLASRAPRLADVRDGWFAYWVEQLRCTVRPHRKLWEFAVVLQTMYEAGVLTQDARVLGFGVGDEPIPSYLAGLGLQVVATDLPEVAERDYVLNPMFVAPDAFDAKVEVSNLDMRRLDDATLRGFDACWSCSVLGEMKTLEEAADTAIGTMDVLRPGGVAIHTLDFAFADEMLYSPRGALVFTRNFLERLTDGLNGRGHSVAPLDFSLGGHPLDGYIDLEPFEVDGADAWTRLWSEGLGAPHLKLLQGGVRKTSFALIIRARPQNP